MSQLLNRRGAHSVRARSRRARRQPAVPPEHSPGCQIFNGFQIFLILEQQGIARGKRARAARIPGRFSARYPACFRSGRLPRCEPVPVGARASAGAMSRLRDSKRWTPPGPDARGIGHGSSGSPATASDGSPGSWGSLRTRHRRARRSRPEGATELRRVRPGVPGHPPLRRLVSHHEVRVLGRRHAFLAPSHLRHLRR